ncbi:hypothetical protein ACHQM5_019059 [Ranunculus cassubicifolius]
MSEYDNTHYGEPDDQNYHYGDPKDQHYYYGDPEDEHDANESDEHDANESEDGNEDDSESDESDAEPADEKKPMQFSDIGQPIGPGSIQYSTFVGKMARTHCRPTYVDWFSVPPKAKRHVWRTVLAAYDLDFSRKVGVLEKAMNVSWKNWKYRLRLSYDKYSTDTERRVNVPKGVKKEDWEEFVQICSTEEEQLKRGKGKLSRTKMKLPHTSGRRGAARTLEELKKQSSDGKVTRTQLFVAIHTINDGTCPFPEARPTLDEITRLVTLKPYLAHRDLDNDPVALCSTPPVETHAFPQSTRCLVKSFRNKTLALGNVRTDVTPENDSYQIRIADIFDHSAELYEGGTFEDIRIGSTIIWPKHSIELI